MRKIFDADEKMVWEEGNKESPMSYAYAFEGMSGAHKPTDGTVCNSDGKDTTIYHMPFLASCEASGHETPCVAGLNNLGYEGLETTYCAEGFLEFIPFTYCPHCGKLIK